MDLKTHWETIYTTKEPNEVSWYQNIPQLSLELIAATGAETTAPIIDVGGGTSMLVDQLLQRGYEHVTVLDISGAALRQAQSRLGAASRAVTWIEDDITQVKLPAAHYTVWHDRAVFHFLTGEKERTRYLQAVRQAVKPGGYVIVGSFALDGPTECSNRSVMRYSAGALQATFGSPFELLDSRQELHQTPWGSTQSFVYALMRAGDAVDTERPADRRLDAGQSGCGELTLLIFQEMKQLAPGQTLEVLAYDLAAGVDIPAWCRQTRNPLIKSDLAAHPQRFIIQKQRSDSNV